MLITEELFAAFVNCETKSILKAIDTSEDRSEFLDWQRRVLDDYKLKCHRRLRANLHKDECFIGSMSLEDLRTKHYRLIIDCAVGAEGIQSTVHALERSAFSVKRKHDGYIPIRFAAAQKITRHDKLLLAFDAEQALC